MMVRYWCPLKQKMFEVELTRETQARRFVGQYYGNRIHCPYCKKKHKVRYMP